MKRAIIMLLCMAVVASACMAPRNYECGVYGIDGRFYSTLLTNRHGLVTAWRFDKNGERRTFYFAKDRMENCKEIDNAG